MLSSLLQNKTTLLTATVGEVLVTATGAIEPPSPDEVQTFGQLIIQIIIGIVTVWKLWRDGKKSK